MRFASSMPSPYFAETAATGAPIASASFAVSMPMPSLRASSDMLTTTTSGTPVARSASTSGSCSSIRVALTIATIASRATVSTNRRTSASSSECPSSV